jgi:putative ABC transport system permease protein
VVGLGLGVGVAAGLPALFHAFGADLPSAAPVVRPRTVLAALLVGPGVTASAALLPARRAASVPPVAAMRAAAAPDRPLARRTAAGLTLAATGAVAMALGLTGRGLQVLGGGAVGVLTGVALLSPLAARPVVGGLGRLAGRSVPGSLGRQNSLRDPRRTAATAAALMIGLALVAAVGVLGASLKQSVRRDVAAALTADYVVTPTAVGIGPDAYDALTRAPGVGTVTGLRGGSARLADATVSVSALDPAALGRTVTLETDRGEAELGPGTVLVADDTARERHLEIGRTVPVTWEDGERGELRVAGTYAPNQLLGDYLVDDSAADHFARRLYVAALIDADGDPAPVRTALDDALRPYPAVLVQDTGQFVAATAKQVDQLVRFLQLLLALSVGIALLGVANTLALSVLERTRELGLLRAVGMQRRQVKAMVQVEAVLVAVFGGLLGLVVGVGFGIALQRALADQGIPALSIPVGQLLLYVLLAASAGMTAAWLPARRAAKLDVLRAVSSG